MLTQEEIERRIKEIRPELEVVGLYEGTSKPLRVRCTCGHEWEPRAASLLCESAQCPACKKRKREERFYRLAAENSPNLEIVGKYIRSDKKVLCRCRKCGHLIYARARDITKGIDGCSNCGATGSSYTERFVLYFLRDVLGAEKVLSHNKTLIGSQLDIYLPSYNLAIEPGSWFWHWDKTTKDEEKKRKCEALGVELIVIYDACGCFYNQDYLEQAPKGSILYECELSDPKNKDELHELCMLLYNKISGEKLAADYDWNIIHKQASKKTVKRKDAVPHHKKPLPGNAPKKNLPDGYKLKGRKKKPPKPKKEFDKSTSLAVRFPNIAKAYSLDNDKPSDEVPPMSKTLFKWECPDCHIRFECPPITFTDIDGDKFSCPECGTKNLPSFAEVLLWMCFQDVLGHGKVVFGDDSCGFSAPLTVYVPVLKFGVMLYGRRLESLGASACDIVAQAKERGIDLVIVFHMSEPPKELDPGTDRIHIIEHAICKTQCEDYAEAISNITALLCEKADQAGMRHKSPKSKDEVLARRKMASRKVYANPLTGQSLASVSGINELWDYRRNGKYRPENVSRQTISTFWLKCRECGYEFTVPGKADEVHCPRCHESTGSNNGNNFASAACTNPVVLDYWDWDNNEASPYDISLSKRGRLQS